VIDKRVDDIPEFRWRGKARAEVGVHGFRLASKLVSILDAMLNKGCRKEDEILEGRSGVFLVVLGWHHIRDDWIVTTTVVCQADIVIRLV
jgi:hypothetical protein